MASLSALPKAAKKGLGMGMEDAALGLAGTAAAFVLSPEKRRSEPLCNPDKCAPTPAPSLQTLGTA